MSYIKTIFHDLGLIKHLDKDKINIACLIHHEKNGQSLYIDFTKNFYRCYGKCQCGGSLQELLINLGVDTILDNQYLIESMLQSKIEESVKKELKDLDFSKHLYFSKSSKNLQDIPYLNKRGLDQEIYQANHIYQNEYTKRIVIPVLFEEKYYGDITRTIFNEQQTLNKIADETGIEINQVNKKDVLFSLLYEDDEIYNKYKDMSWKTKWHERYLNDYFLPKERILYEPLTNNPECDVYLIQEGSLDSLYANMFGYNSYAVIGNGINQFHVNYLLNKLEGKIIIKAFDNDEAGSKYSEKMNQLGKQFFLKLDWSLINRRVKDVADLTKDEVDYLVRNATY